MKLSDLGEESLLSLIRDWTETSANRVRLGAGDDAAILAPSGDREIVVSTDSWLEGVHFSRAYLAPNEIGHRVMAGSLSDLAAMGAEGVAAFVNLHAPPDTSVEFVRQIYSGLDRVADACGVAIAGGDTVRGPFSLGITVIGTVTAGLAWRRNGARIGDALCVSGELGGSEAGRRLLAKDTAHDFPPALRAEAESAHRSPRPRFDVSRLLHSVQRRTVDLPRKREVLEDVRPTAAIDVSDGLGLDLTRLCEASGVGCRLDERNVPISRAARRLARDDHRREIDAALGGGEDFELLFAWPAADLGLLQRAAQERSIAITPIGAVVSRDEGCVLVCADGKEEPLPALGWDHFRSVPGSGK